MNVYLSSAGTKSKKTKKTMLVQGYSFMQ
jgi:hypothetical protein